MPNKELGIADPVYDALRIRSGQSIAPDLGGGSTGTGGIENKIYVWHADGSTIDTFDPDAAGLALAIAAAVSGDTVWLPSVTITASPTIPADIVVIGIDIANSIIAGSVTNNGSLQNLSITGNVTNNSLMSDVIVNVSSGVGITQVDGTLNNVHVIASDTATYSIDYQGGYLYNCHTSWTSGTPTGIKINLPSFPGEIDRCLFSGKTGGEFIDAPLTVISNCQFEGGQSGSGLVFTGAGSGHISNSRFYWRGPGTGFSLDVNATGLTLTDCAWTTIDGLANITYGTGDRGAYSVEDYHATDIEANILTRHLTQPTGSVADAGKCDVLNASGTAWELAAVPIGSSTDSFVSDVAHGTVSSELFTLEHGVNEFDLLYENGYYHWFYTTYEPGDYNVHHRAALTVMGLETAADAVILSATDLVVPTAILVGLTWHLWVTTIGISRATHHYTASNPDGPWTFADDVAGEVGDPHVRKWDIDDNYYMAYVDDGANWKIGLKRSSSTSGPWTDLGYIFSALGKQTWYTLESDPAIFFRGTRAYVSFGGYDNVSTQVCGLVELNTTSWKALDVGTIIVEPTEPWMQRNGAHRVYNPVWLEHDGLMYFSHNPYNGGFDSSIETGWGYIQPAHPGLSVLDTATVDLTLIGQLLTADVIPGGIDAADLGSGTATDGQVLTADGAGGAEWRNHVDPINVYNETQSANGTGLTYYLTNYAAPSTIRVYIDGIRQPASDDSAPTDVVSFSVAPDLGAVLLFDYEMDLT